MCKGFIASGDYSSIYSTLERVEVLESRLQVLRSGSSGGDEVKKTSERMRLVARVLEDLLLNAMEGADIGQMHSRGVLLYQSVEDIN